jgi:hypothetical protein
MGDDQREIARIDDVMIVRQQDGRFSINAPQGRWDLDERDVDATLNFLFLGRQGQH